LVVVTPYSVTYNGSAHTADGDVDHGGGRSTGATVGTVDVSHTTHTDAGIYSTDFWIFTGTANYNDIAQRRSPTRSTKANAVVVVTPYTVTYDGNPHTATLASITGVVNSETGATVGTVNVSNTTHTNADTYNADFWTSRARRTTTTSARPPSTDRIYQSGGDC
jgi:hypothetical protein